MCGRPRRGALALGFLFLLLPAPALAEREFVVTPWAGYVTGGSFRESGSNDVLYVDEAAVFGFVLDLLDEPRAYYELVYGFQRTDLSANDPAGGNIRLDLDIHYLHLGGMYEFPQESMRPFVAAGLGLTALVPDGPGADSSTNFSFSVGGGVQIPLSERVGLRLEGRGYLTVISDNTQIFCVSSGSGGGCAAGVEGDSLGQLVLLAGISFRL